MNDGSVEDFWAKFFLNGWERLFFFFGFHPRLIFFLINADRPRFFYIYKQCNFGMQAS